MGRHHARIYSELAQVQLAAVVDTNELLAREMAKKLHTRYYTDYRKLLGKVDLVSIATPTSLHHRIARECLQAGIHVLVEKPMTSTVEEADDLITIAEANNVLLQVGHIERFNPAVTALQGLVRNPIFIEAHRMGPPTTRNLDVGVILELMIHDLDIILNLVNSPIKTVHALGLRIYSEFEDIVQAQILFENGCIASLACSRVSAEKVRNLEITQEDAFVHLDYIEQDIILRKQVSSRYIFDQPRAVYRREFMVEQPLIAKDEPLRLELQHFARSVAGDARPLVSGEDGRNAMAVARQVLDCMVISNSKENRLAKELLVMVK